MSAAGSHPAGGISIGKVCGLSRRHGGSLGQGSSESSGKWKRGVDSSLLCICPRAGSAPGALVVGTATAGGEQDGTTAGLGLPQHWALGAAGAQGHRGISLGVLPSLLWRIQGTKALQSPWFDNCSLFQCRVLPLPLEGLKRRGFSKSDKTSHFRGWKTSSLCFFLCKTTARSWAVIPYSKGLGALQG